LQGFFDHSCSEYNIEGFQDLTGYKVLNQYKELLGVITEVIPNPGQLLLKITSPKNTDILIPWHEDFIVSIDKEKKILIVDIPDGLTEIN
jgi:16S rRNA processing protein RimM